MKNTGTLKVTTRGDREIVMERVFDAPRELVWEAMTTPELVKRWYGPRGHDLVVCEIDFRVGGKWRYVLRGPDGRQLVQYGEFREIAKPERIVMTEDMEGFCDPNGSALDTMTLVDQAGKTKLTLAIQAPSKEARDGMIAAGMEHGAAETYDRLNEMLTTR